MVALRNEYRGWVQRKADLVAEADRLVQDGKAANAFPLKDEAAGRYMAIKTEVNELRQLIEAEEEHRDMLRSVEPPTPAPSRANVTGIRDRVEDDPKRGFTSMADFALSVRSAFKPGEAFDPRLNYVAAPSDFHQETGGSSGDGYTVPPDFSTTIIDLVNALEVDQDVMQLLGPKPTSSNAVQILLDQTTVWSGLGIQANWRGEGQQMTPTKLVTDGRSTRLWELYVFVLATEEMLQDVAGLQDRLTAKSAAATRWKVGEAFVRGTGVAQPQGFLNSGAIVSQAKEVAQTAATVVAANVANMYSRLIRTPASKAFWLAHFDVFPQLMTMSIAYQPIWIPPSGFFTGPGGMLLGMPVYLSEHCEALGTQGDILLINPDGYAAYRRTSDPAFASSMHLYFDYNIDAFRWTFRFGGQPLLSAPIAAAKGTNSRSHFVGLATRA
ncbi:MAG TPA: phage major capsid protein [Thermomicrobiaceae bacterium]|nr:phage major capsid protein [Thermomicrobiaceae bacterium]